jgi:uncharacterized protein (TIGR02646 family)
LKKIIKTAGPNGLTRFYHQNPLGSWDDFFYHNTSIPYKKLKADIFADQGGLCAYCETQVSKRFVHEQRVEHFHDKSDNSNIAVHNWGLDWNNVIGMCVGGTEHANKTTYQLPANLSCDSHKERVLTAAPEGVVLNPLLIFASPCLFDLDKRTGELKPHALNCANLCIVGNTFTTVDELVANTIRIFNLNCDRLNQQRKAILFDYNRRIKIARENGDEQVFAKLTRQWFTQKWLPFFTTRRILLSNHAEAYLSQINFNG